MSKELPELQPKLEAPTRARTLGSALELLEELAADGCDDSFVCIRLHPDGMVQSVGVTRGLRDQRDIVVCALDAMRKVAAGTGAGASEKLAALFLQMLGIGVVDYGGIVHVPVPPKQ